jgi:hypothetical protein
LINQFSYFSNHFIVDAVAVTKTNRNYCSTHTIVVSTHGLGQRQIQTYLSFQGKQAALKNMQLNLDYFTFKATIIRRLFKVPYFVFMSFYSRHLYFEINFIFFRWQGFKFIMKEELF